MESVVVDEDEVHRGDDASEESSTRMVEDPSIKKAEQDSSGNSVRSSLAGSMKSTVKSATGFIPASLGGWAEEGKGGNGSSVSDEGASSEVSKEAEAIGDDDSRGEERASEMSSQEGTITDDPAEGWSVVDPFPEEAAESQAQFESPPASVGGEEDERHGLEDANSSVEAQSSPSIVSVEPEIVEEKRQTATSPSENFAGSSFVPSSVLRRRPRASSEGRRNDDNDTYNLNFPDGGDLSAMAEWEGAFEPRNVLSPPRRDDDNDTFSLNLPDGGDLSALAEWEGAFEPRHDPSPAESGATQGHVNELQNELGNNSLSKGDNSLPEVVISPSSNGENFVVKEDNSPSKGDISRSKVDFPLSMDGNSLSKGDNSLSKGDNSLSKGDNSLSKGDNSLSKGDNSLSKGDNSLSMGDNSLSLGEKCLSMGHSPSKGDNSNHSTPRKEPEIRSGYDPELEGDDDDASSISSKDPQPDLGVEQWRRRRSQPEEGWEDLGSSSDLDEKVAPPLPAEARSVRREVYRMPTSDAEAEDDQNEEESPTQLLTYPVGFIVRAVEFQLNLIVHVIAVGIWLFNFSLSTISHPVNRTVAVKERVTSVTTGAATQVGNLFSFFGDGVAQAGPRVSKLSKQTFWCCLSVAYVLSVLGLLLVPALFVNLAIVNTVVEDPVVIREALHFDYTQPKPVALLPLFSEAEVERIQNLPRHKPVKTRVIPQGNWFHISVVLTLPESDYNMKLGMFQLTAELLSARGDVILRSSKPCRLKFRSGPVQLVKSLIYTLPHLVGLVKEGQTIEVWLLEGREKVTPTASVRILIESTASFQGGGGVPEIYGATVTLESTLPWPRGVLSSWKWLFFVWNGVCVFMLEVIMVLCCCRKLIFPSFGRQAAGEDEVVVGRAMRESSRRARGSRRVYFEDGIPGAAGAHDGKGTRTPSSDPQDAGIEREARP